MSLTKELGLTVINPLYFQFPPVPKSIQAWLGSTLFEFCIAIALETRADTNSPPPRELAAARQKPLPVPFYDMPSASLDADKTENTSAAPFPKAKSVTPAKDYDILRVFDMFAKIGDRQPSAVDPKTQKHTYIANNPTGMKRATD